jgi:hypothetical protein
VGGGRLSHVFSKKFTVKNVSFEVFMSFEALKIFLENFAYLPSPPRIQPALPPSSNSVF